MYKEKVENDSDYADAYYNLAIIYVELDEFHKAIEYLKIAIDLNEEFIEYAKEESRLISVLEKLQKTYCINT